jgi:hypothetical protein
MQPVIRDLSCCVFILLRTDSARDSMKQAKKLQNRPGFRTFPIKCSLFITSFLLLMAFVAGHNICMKPLVRFHSSIKQCTTNRCELSSCKTLAATGRCVLKQCPVLVSRAQQRMELSERCFGELIEEKYCLVCCKRGVQRFK